MFDKFTKYHKTKDLRHKLILVAFLIIAYGATLFVVNHYQHAKQKTLRHELGVRINFHWFHGISSPHIFVKTFKII